MEARGPAEETGGASTVLGSNWPLRPRFQEVEMAAERLSMRKLRELFRLRFETRLSTRAIAASLPGAGTDSEAAVAAAAGAG